MSTKRPRRHFSVFAESAVQFLFEAAVLKRLQRTGWQILGGNDESVAEHSFMVSIIGYMLASSLGADIEKVLLMGLFHDFGEVRTGDVYRLADSYVTVDMKSVLADGFRNSPQSGTIRKLLEEYESRRTLEAKIVKDADTLALCVELKCLVEQGNTNAQEWLDANIQQLVLPHAHHIGTLLLCTSSQEWWRKEREEIHRKNRRKTSSTGEVA